MGAYGCCVLFLALTIPCWAYSRGAPRHACHEGMPMHGPDPQETPSPYTIAAEMAEGATGGNTFKVKVTLGGSEPFRGFLVQALDDDMTLTGGFMDLPADTSTLGCSRDYPESSITHTNANPKDEVVLYWESPESYDQTIYFRVSFVQTQPVFWVDQMASYDYVPLTTSTTLAAEPEPTDPTEPEPSDGATTGISVAMVTAMLALPLCILQCLKH